MFTSLNHDLHSGTNSTLICSCRSFLSMIAVLGNEPRLLMKVHSSNGLHYPETTHDVISLLSIFLYTLKTESVSLRGLMDT